MCSDGGVGRGIESPVASLPNRICQKKVKQCKKKSNVGQSVRRIKFMDI